MNRRIFLSALGKAAVGVAAGAALPAIIEPEPELWTPKRTYFDLGAGRDRTSFMTYHLSREHGLTIRMVRDYPDFSFPARYDVLYGFATIRPDLATRVSDEFDAVIQGAVKAMADHRDAFASMLESYAMAAAREKAMQFAVVTDLA